MRGGRKKKVKMLQERRICREYFSSISVVRFAEYSLVSEHPRDYDRLFPRRGTVAEFDLAVHRGKRRSGIYEKSARIESLEMRSPMKAI